jgi:hypothetical protein
MMCTSFWVGLFSVIFLKFSPTMTYIVSDTEEASLLQLIYALLFDAFSVVGFVWFVYILQSFFEDKLTREL